MEELISHNSTNKTFGFEEGHLSFDPEALEGNFQVLIFKKTSVLEDCKVSKLSYKPFLIDFVWIEWSLSVFDFLVVVWFIPSPSTSL